MQAQDTSIRRAEESALCFRREFGIRDLASAAKIPLWLAGRTLGRLMHEGFVEHTGNGRWRVLR